GRGLRVVNCYFHHNENGILAAASAGTVEVLHSEFGWNGFGDGGSHNIYVAGGERFVLHGSYMHHAKAGNVVKSRAAVNIFTYNRLSQETGDGSYELDISNGGQALVLGNVIQQGMESVNEHMITFGMEGARRGSKMVFSHNTVVNIRPSARYFLHAPGTVIEARNNLFAGKAVMGLNDGAPPAGNVLDPEMKVMDAAGHNYAPGPGSPAIDAARDAGEWDGKRVIPEWQYVKPGCVQARVAHGRMDAGAIEAGSNDAPAVCTAAPAPAVDKKKK
ncbi:MAG: hypothetical protein IH602_19265, partial [Bryobacteraceae bacterium]|nr:hypothetical protein [Bryobacteraceae bacterium]